LPLEAFSASFTFLHFSSVYYRLDSFIFEIADLFFFEEIFSSAFFLSHAASRRLRRH